MKKYFFIVICAFSLMVHADQRAVTDEGEIVILKDDGTWVYEGSDTNQISEIPINDGVFEKSEESSFRIKSTKNNSEYWINPKKWDFAKAESKSEAEYQFKLKNGDLYGLAITEEIEIDVENLAQIALQNAKQVAPDARITKQEYRMVNGNKVIYMEMQGTIQGIDFTYLGHYFSNSSGATQYLTYTGTSLVKNYQSEIETFLNGFSTQ